MRETPPRVLLLGDSIRMGYEPAVAKALNGVANVVGPAENCQFSLYTLSSLDRWLEQLGRPDIIHWNNGLHDVGHNPCRCPEQIPVEMYCGNLEYILKHLQKTEAPIIWATSTPYHPDKVFESGEWWWHLEEIKQYNAAALEVMKRYAIPVNDLHSVVASDMDRYLCEDLIHLSEAGIEACAEAVVRIVNSHLSRITSAGTGQ